MTLGPPPPSMQERLSSHYDWTRRQREVLSLITAGKTNTQIADELNISLAGAKWHVSEILSKLNADSREEAAEYWRRYNGLAPRFARIFRGVGGLGALKVAIAGAGVGVLAVGTIFVALALSTDEDSAPAPEQQAETLPPEVQHVVDVLLAGDVNEFVSLIQELPESCAASPSGVGSPPPCPPGVPDGGTINTFRYIGCERGYPGAQQDETIRTAMSRSRRLYSAFRPTSGTMFQLFSKGDYSLVFASDLQGATLGERYEVTGGRISGMWLACGPGLATLRGMTEDVASMVVPPTFALPTPTPVPHTPAAGPDGYPLTRRTGQGPAPDTVLEALSSGNPDRVAAHFAFYPMGCITSPTGIPSPPFCKPGEAAGTPVQVFPVGQCEGEFLERDEVPAVARQLVEPTSRIWAIYRQQPVVPAAFYDFPIGSVVIVMNQSGHGVALQVEGGNILSVWLGCGTSAADMVKGVPAVDFILPPPR